MLTILMLQRIISIETTGLEKMNVTFTEMCLMTRSSCDILIDMSNKIIFY